MDVDPTRTLAFPTPANFAEWLAQNHARESEVWVKLYKKSSGVSSVSWSEAVVEAIAWGWIDGIKKSSDETSWFQRFTPRSAKSGWSKINRDHAERLTAEGRMRDPGLKTVIAAKADGRWDAAYAGSAGMEFPDAFLAAIAENTTAKTTFANLKRAQLYSMYHRLHTAKKEETRRNLMTKMIEMLSRGEVFR